jgi:hypothetical protein
MELMAASFGHIDKRLKRLDAVAAGADAPAAALADPAAAALVAQLDGIVKVVVVSVSPCERARSLARSIFGAPTDSLQTLRALMYSFERNMLHNGA